MAPSIPSGSTPRCLRSAHTLRHTLLYPPFPTPTLLLPLVLLLLFPLSLNGLASSVYTHLNTHLGWAWGTHAAELAVLAELGVEMVDDLSLLAAQDFAGHRLSSTLNLGHVGRLLELQHLAPPRDDSGGGGGGGGGGGSGGSGSGSGSGGGGGGGGGSLVAATGGAKEVAHGQRVSAHPTWEYIKDIAAPLPSTSPAGAWDVSSGFRPSDDDVVQGAKGSDRTAGPPWRVDRLHLRDYARDYARDYDLDYDRGSKGYTDDHTHARGQRPSHNHLHSLPPLLPPLLPPFLPPLLPPLLPPPPPPTLLVDRLIQALNRDSVVVIDGFLGSARTRAVLDDCTELLRTSKSHYNIQCSEIFTQRNENFHTKT